MDRNELINRLVNRKITTSAKGKGCVPCFGTVVPGKQKISTAGTQRPVQSATKKQ